jgi:hypothetical protein
MVSGNFHTFRAAAEYERGMCGLFGFDDGGETLRSVLIETGGAVDATARGN